MKTDMAKYLVNDAWKTLEQHEAGKFLPKMQDEDFSELCEDIKEKGLLFPIWLYNDKVLDGWHRLQACIKHNKQPFFEIYKGDSPLGFVVSSAKRRNLTAGQRACLASEMLPELEKEAKARMISYGSIGGKSKGTQNLRTLPSTAEKAIDDYISDKYIALQDSGSKGEATVQAAQIFQSNPQYVHDVKKIKQSHPDKYELIRTGKANIHETKREIKREAVQKKIAVIEKQAVINPTGKYSVLVIDPPWHMEKIEREVAPLQMGFDYPTMELDDIKKLTLVNDFAEDDCHVFLWTTQKYLPYAFDILSAWNLKYVFTMTWHKNGGFQPFNLPQYNSEFVLYGKRGNPLWKETKNFNTCFSADRTKHSEKPQEFYDLLNRITVGRRLDCFNRRAITGFDTWGNEAKA